MATRVITRIAWNFSGGIPVPVLPTEKRGLCRQPDPYQLYAAVGELFQQEGNLWLDIYRPERHGRKRYSEQSFWIKLFQEELNKRVFTAVWPDSEE